MRIRKLAVTTVALGLSLALGGCSKSSAGNNDQALTAAVQSKLTADPALKGTGLTANVENGVATLTGTASSDAERTAAAMDAQVPGVTQVNNEIATNTPANGATVAPVAGMKADTHAARSAPASSSAMMAMHAAAPVEVEAGTPISIRLTQPLSSATASAGQSFDATVDAPILVNGAVAVPKGALVTGTVAAADSAGHFKGQSRLVLKLSQLSYDGQSYDLSTQSVTRLASSRGKRSAIAIGGGAALGAVIGALAGHGKGAAIGAAGGAGAGTAAEALTKPAEVALPAETVLRFHLASALQVVPAASAH
ncbi:MAG: BON domain-containing protein [Terriglobales bacterium]